MVIVVWECIWGIGLPFAGTVLGAAVVYGLPVNRQGIDRWLCGFSGGAMLAAVFCSLLVPGFEVDFWQTALGFTVGMLSPWLLDMTLEQWNKSLSSTTMLLLAVALHNISEGLAVGAGLAGRISGQIGPADAATLPLGIALQNVPDGVVVVLPLAAVGMTRNRVFAKGLLSGAVEPLASILMLLCWAVISPILPLFLGFAGGSMIHVVLTELIPQMMDSEGECRARGAFVLGFLLISGVNHLCG